MCAQGCTARKGAGGALTALAGLTGLRELHVHGLGGCEGAALEALLAALPGLKALSLGAPTPAAAAPALSALRAITGLRSLHVRRRALAAVPGADGGVLCPPSVQADRPVLAQCMRIWLTVCFAACLARASQRSSSIRERRSSWIDARVRAGPGRPFRPPHNGGRCRPAPCARAGGGGRGRAAAGPGSRVAAGAPGGPGRAGPAVRRRDRRLPARPGRRRAAAHPARAAPALPPAPAAQACRASDTAGGPALACAPRRWLLRSGPCSALALSLKPATHRYLTPANSLESACRPPARPRRGAARRRLRLCGENAVTDAGLRAVGSLRALRRLEFSAPIRRSLAAEALSVAGLGALAGLTALTELNLSGNACFTSAGARRGREPGAWPGRAGACHGSARLRRGCWGVTALWS